jgi:hypothetical protein
MKESNYYKIIQNIYNEDRNNIFVNEIKEEQDIVLLIDILSLEFVPEPLRCFKTFDGISVIGCFLGTLRELGYETTYEETKRICQAAKQRYKTKKKLLIKESLGI